MESSSSSSSCFSYLMFNIVIILLSISLVYPQKVLSYRCHDHERSALLQFKQTFTIVINNSRPFGCDDSSYPKDVSSWNVQGDHNSSKDCCMWDGIDCDEDTGHVIGLDLSCSLLFGSISSNSSLFHLVHLQRLILTYTGFSGKLPDSLGNLTQLIELDLSINNFSGHIPSSFYQLKNLEILDLSGNQLSGTVDLDMFVFLKKLSYFSLSHNDLSVISSSTYSNTNSTVAAQLEVLYLDSCNLTKFPEFLRNQTKLSELSLSNNSIQGLIPVWIFNNTILEWLDLSLNSLTGFDQSPVFNPHSKLQNLYIYNNRLKGSLPIPPPSIYEYDVSNNVLEGKIPSLIGNLTSLTQLYLANNALKGEIPPSICNLTSLGDLDLSDNGFSGKLPPCLVNLSSLSFLQLQGNYFGGTIPDIWKDECRLLKMVLSENQFEGELPRSLANCTRLEILDVGNNQIKDSFPFWLGTLPGLKILVVKFNRFYGAVRVPDHHPTKTPMFPMLHIIDLSHNFFSGHLPVDYFQQWNSLIFNETREWHSIPGSVIITYKGIAREYEYYIQNLLNLIDLSSNKFEGEIPELIGNLNGLHSLNISYNFLTGSIPSSLANLSQIEALELSHNKLSGQIPQQLTQLTFLAIFSVAHNNLSGPIPHGKQFDTFLNSSFEGNVGLCGKPLSEECGNSKDSPPPSSTIEEEEKDSSLEFGWKPVVIGYGCGLVIAIVVGHFVINI